eukprot:4831971-Amphidinium_carterae.1
MSPEAGCEQSIRITLEMPNVRYLSPSFCKLLIGFWGMIAKQTLLGDEMLKGDALQYFYSLSLPLRHAQRSSPHLCRG